jgi:hypothetical protein
MEFGDPKSIGNHNFLAIADNLVFKTSQLTIPILNSFIQTACLWCFGSWDDEQHLLGKILPPEAAA